jgi:hypothetical protein
MRFTSLIIAALLLAACSKSAPPAPSAPEPTGEVPADKPAARPALSAADCAAQGGEVVGDIGDGAIHQPDYRCASNGEPPMATIAADPGGPVAIEGSVCCKKAN